ncbi:MAG: hypothetical protein IJI14_16150 [Anaerolineaceae bacterium]|nr:hypothetical protein [Anaerolineaceae bacterium]
MKGCLDHEFPGIDNSDSSQHQKTAVINQGLPVKTSLRFFSICQNKRHMTYIGIPTPIIFCNILLLLREVKKKKSKLLETANKTPKKRKNPLLFKRREKKDKKKKNAQKRSPSISG